MAVSSRYSFEFIATSLGKILAFSALTFYLAAIFLSNRSTCPLVTNFFSNTPLSISSSSSKSYYDASSDVDPTSINHLIFGLVGSVKTWKHRKAYIQSWWKPNITRGYIYLDTPPTNDLLPWSPYSPPYRVSDNITISLPHKAPIAIRIIHAIMEVFREGDEGVRWYVMGDDDSIFFIDNWVDVLSKYDHTKFVYVGGHSESILANVRHSFEMGFGGAGFALSYPLAEILFKELENCIKRYPLVIVSDEMLSKCVADFGVSPSFEKGIHQIDLRGHIFGVLSSHPQAPLLSLHHLDFVNPIFPLKKKIASLNRLMKASRADHVRLLQQTVCYHKPSNWSFSISWGYSTHIYENIIPRSELKKPLNTFKPWAKDAQPPLYMFNTRPLSKDPCEVPHMYFLDSIKKKTSENQIVTRYVRLWNRDLIACSSSGNHSADSIWKVKVVSPMAKSNESGKSECCDVLEAGENGKAEVKIRECFKNELIA